MFKTVNKVIRFEKVFILGFMVGFRGGLIWFVLVGWRGVGFIGVGVGFFGFRYFV